MAGERTKDLRKLSITIVAEGVGTRTLTSIFDWDPGEGPELSKMTDPDIKGKVTTVDLDNESRQPKLKVRVGSQDERFLDKIIIARAEFSMTVVDNSNKGYGKQVSAKYCKIQKAPADPYRDGTEREYQLLCPEYIEKQI